MNQSVSNKIYRSHFDFHVFYLGYYLSQNLRKIKFVTDGTFDAIHIIVGLSFDSVELKNRSLTINLHFDFKFYDNADEKTRCTYSIELMTRALQIASENKYIPLKTLIGNLKDLADNGYVDCWKFKDMTIPEYNLKIKLICQLSTNDFILKIMAFNKKNTVLVCEGNVLRTKPDDIYFSYISKKVKIKNGEIVISSTWDTELLSIELERLSNGQLVVKFSSTPYPDDIRATENFKQLQNELKYDNDQFV